MTIQAQSSILWKNPIAALYKGWKIVIFGVADKLKIVFDKEINFFDLNK